MNGQDRGEEHYQSFKRWASELTDGEAKCIIHGGQLSRKEIMRSIGCARSVLTQNPRIKAALTQLEQGLRTRGVLPLAEVTDHALPIRTVGQFERASDKARLKKIEAENVALRAANQELRKRILRFEAIEAHLAATGRIAR